MTNVVHLPSFSQPDRLGFFCVQKFLKKLAKNHITLPIFSPRRVSEEVKRLSSRTLKAEYAALRFISAICGATCFLPPWLLRNERSTEKQNRPVGMACLPGSICGIMILPSSRSYCGRPGEFHGEVKRPMSVRTRTRVGGFPYSVWGVGDKWDCECTI